MKTKILQVLKQAESYISGQELCTRLGVSRTAIWKVINQLKEEGYVIQSVNNRGYLLEESPDLVTEPEVLSELSTKWAGSIVCHVPELGSTNTHAKQLAEQGCPHGTLVTAEMQNTGKGRRGRGWSMKPGTSVAMTLVMRPDIQPMHASRLTLVMGLAVARACRETAGVEAKIKWPNDVVVNGKKICGILTEMSAQVDYIDYLVTGVGINTSLTEFPEEIRDKATSLLQETGTAVRRSRLIAKVLDYFEEYYKQFLVTEDLSALQEEYNGYLVHQDAEVKVFENGKEICGIARGINQSGELLVETPQGEVIRIYAGEVSVRGLYGYV